MSSSETTAIADSNVSDSLEASDQSSSDQSSLNHSSSDQSSVPAHVPTMQSEVQLKKADAHVAGGIESLAVHVSTPPRDGLSSHPGLDAAGVNDSNVAHVLTSSPDELSLSSHMEIAGNDDSKTLHITAVSEADITPSTETDVAGGIALDNALRKIMANITGTIKETQAVELLVKIFKLRGLLAPTWPTKAHQAHLLGLPKELSDKILMLLLVDQELANPYAIQDSLPNSESSPPKAYNIHVAILRTCKTLNQEGTPYLYKTNTFYNICGGQSRKPEQNQSPITLWPMHQMSTPFSSIINESSITKVEKWKILVFFSVVEVSRMEQDLNYKVFLDFCRAIQDGSIKSLEIHVANIDGQTPPQLVQEHELAVFLQPLTLLKKPLALTIKSASHIDPNHFHQNSRSNGWTSVPDARFDDVVVALEKQFQALLATERPPIQIYEMNCALRDYAQTFEQTWAFKMDMGFGRRETFNLDSFTRGVPLGYGNGRMQQNPYKDFFKWHPVEEGLANAADACDLFDFETFREHRAAVVRYLEPQWNRLYRISCLLVDHIKAEKASYGLFDVARLEKIYISNGLSTQTFYARCVVLLQDFHAAFERDRSLEIRVDMFARRTQLICTQQKYMTKVELKRLEAIFASKDWVNFVYLFVDIYSSPEEDYLAILGARKVLFKYDTDAPEEWPIQLNFCLDEDPTRFDRVEEDLWIQGRPDDWSTVADEEEIWYGFRKLMFLEEDDVPVNVRLSPDLIAEKMVFKSMESGRTRRASF